MNFDKLTQFVIAKILTIAKIKICSVSITKKIFPHTSVPPFPCSYGNF